MNNQRTKEIEQLALHEPVVYSALHLMRDGRVTYTDALEIMVLKLAHDKHTNYQELVRARSMQISVLPSGKTHEEMLDDLEDALND